MIPNVRDRSLTTSGAAATGSFGISLKDSAHLMVILRDTLYSDKILAVIREYSANAWDAHRSIGKGDVPISVTLPTLMSPTLVIEDFGPGLSHEDVFTVYTQYGASSKRNDDNAVGMLGIGSKSGFAYSDSFTVISRHGGMRRTYVATLDKSDEGVISLLHEEECGDATGITVKVAVKSGDIEEFRNKAKKLFEHFRPLPTCNIGIVDVTKLPVALKNGYLLSNSELGYDEVGWTAVMGCIPYRINMGQLRNLPRYVESISGVLYFNIGDVQINASREELKYSDDTKKAIAAKLEALVEEFVRTTLAGILKEDVSDWEKRVRSLVFRKLHLPVPAELKKLSDSVIEAQMFQPSFHIKRKALKKKEGGSGQEQDTKHIHVRANARMLLVDDRRARSGYELTDHDYLVFANNSKTSWETITADLEAFLSSLGIGGMPILRISSLAWENPRKPSATGAKSLHHVARVFRMNNHRFHSRKCSQNWDIVTRTPDPSDVYVVIENFKPYFSFSSEYEKTHMVFQALNQLMPPIYGYKTTEKRPLDRTTIVGTSFQAWLRTAFTRFDTSCMRELISANRLRLEWEARNLSLQRDDITSIIKMLGPEHILSKGLREYGRARRITRRLSARIRNALDELHNFLDPDRDAPDPVEVLMTALRERYPLIKTQGHINQLLRYGLSEHWAEYIQLKDKQMAEKTYGIQRAPVHVDERVDLGDLGGGEPRGASGLPELRALEERAFGATMGRGAWAPHHQEHRRELGEGELLAEG